MKNQIIIDGFDVSVSNIETIYRCDVHDHSGSRELRFVVSSTTGHQSPSLSANWAVIALLIPAMRAQRTLVINHNLSAMLLHFLRTDLQDLLINFDPGLHRIEIEADVGEMHERPRGPMRVGTGFSAGVDSFSALRTFRHSGLSDTFDVTDLLTFSVGAFGERTGRSAVDAFNTAAQRTAEYARDFGVNSHSVRSNLTDFYAGVPGLDFIRTHTLRNAAAASLFENELDVYLYASTFSYAEIDIAAKYDLAHVDPVLLPLLSTTELRFVSASAGNDRIRKTALLADDPAARKLLDVCVTPIPKRAVIVGLGKNCSRCWKCYRTMVTLDALGKLDGFAEIFDLHHYRDNRDTAIATLTHRASKGSKLDEAAVNLYRSSVA